MSESTTVTVSIPGPSASRSKMQKKGWKCWARLLSSVKDPVRDGRDFAGAFLTAGQAAELRPGDVLVHIDESSAHGLGVVGPDGEITWVETCADNWPVNFGPAARELLALSPEARLAAHVEGVSDDQPAPAVPPTDPFPGIEQLAASAAVTPTRDLALAEIRRLMIENNITVADLA